MSRSLRRSDNQTFVRTDGNNNPILEGTRR